MAPNQEQSFNGRKTSEKVLELKLIAQQKSRGTVKCEDMKLQNTFQFKYLGSIFSADGEQKYDVCRRIALAMNRMGQLRQVFNSNISFALKMKVYKAAVCPILTYGSEA